MVTDEQIDQYFEIWWTRNGDKQGENKEIERRAYHAGFRAGAVE